MTGRFAIVGAVALSGLMTLSPRAQTPIPTSIPKPGTFGANRLWHLGVVVRNVEASAKAYADMLGVPVPAVTTPTNPQIPYPPSFKGDRKAYAKYAFVGYGDFAIELMEPVGGSSPWRDFLDKYGEAAHHIAFDVPDVAAATEHLAKYGGTVEIGGVPGAQFAYVNFKEQMGLVIEVGKFHDYRAKNLPATSFGANRSSRIAVVQTDVEKAAKLFQDVTDVDSPPIRVVGGGTNIYPGLPGLAPPNGMKFADRFRLKDIHIELQQPYTDPSPQNPWRLAYNKRGASIYYLGFHVPDPKASIEYLVKKGGTVMMRNKMDAVTYIDMPSPISIKMTLFPPVSEAAGPGISVPR